MILKRKDTQSAQVNIDCGDLSFSFNVVPVVELNCINLYGRDVSAVRALTKFPDQNPNPVQSDVTCIGEDDGFISPIDIFSFAISSPAIPMIKNRPMAIIPP